MDKLIECLCAKFAHIWARFVCVCVSCVLSVYNERIWMLKLHLKYNNVKCVCVFFVLYVCVA